MSIYDYFLKRYGAYTEIQKISLPIIESGSNCLIIAPTGAGKTEAAVLPILERLAKSDDKDGVGIIYITPLRALNRDMVKRLDSIGKEAGITVSVRHGDTKPSERARQARVAPFLLITTPETLQSILPTKTIGLALRNVKAVVVDEIHELYHSKRGAQLSLALERLESMAPGFQRIGISATVGDIKSASAFLCGERKLEVASLAGKKDIEITIELPTKPKVRIKDLEEKFGLDDAAIARLESIAEHVKGSKSTLIFANTRQVVEALGSRLVYLNKEMPFGGIGVHHSSLDREERIGIERRFKDGELKSIIATSSLELGIDIGNIDLVIQYGSPRQALRIAQRVGRSGHTHRGVAKGTIVAPSVLEAIEAAAVVANLDERLLESFPMHINALDVLCTQICGIALDNGTISLESVQKIIGGSHVYGTLGTDAIVRLLSFMTEQRLVGFDGKTVTSGSRTRMYYYGHLSVIPDVKRLIVKNIVENRIISTLDERFVANNVEEGSVFITKGLPWKVISIDNDVISVEPSMEVEAAVPDWVGEDIPVSGRVAKRVFSIIHEAGRGGLDMMDAHLIKKIGEFSADQKLSFGFKTNELVVETFEGYKIIYTGLGTKGNDALARALAHIASIKTGASVNVRTSPYMIMLELPDKVKISALLARIDTAQFRQLVRDAVGESELFRYKFIVVAKLFGVIDRDAVVSRSLARRLMKVLDKSPVYDEAAREIMENMFDTDAALELVGRIKSGAVVLRELELSKLSVISKAILNAAHYTRELITPLTPNSELVESFANHMLKKEIKLVCTYCGFRFARKLSEIKAEKKMLCQSCGSPLISTDEEGYRELVEKRRSGKKLTTKDRETLSEMMRIASLIDSYGGRAAIALSVYGVGAKTAARTLMMFKHDEREFFIDLLEAQKTFIRTKKYWAI
ncbi:MAG TPA: DEAD/DEAH box helicase [Candidatus Acidoferrales bacterium]|nr:DEAD/DEAH box helicase [Candidatus Acidoferrales bacterium]